MRTDIFLGTIELIMQHMTLDQIKAFDADIDNYKDYFVLKNYKNLKALIKDMITRKSEQQESQKSKIKV